MSIGCCKVWRDANKHTPQKLSQGVQHTPDTNAKTQQHIDIMCVSSPEMLAAHSVGLAARSGTRNTQRMNLNAVKLA